MSFNAPYDLDCDASVNQALQSVALVNLVSPKLKMECPERLFGLHTSCSKPNPLSIIVRSVWDSFSFSLSFIPVNVDPMSICRPGCPRT